MSTVREFVPRPRHGGLTPRQVDRDLLTYVEDTHQPSCLNTSAARLWRFYAGARVGAIAVAETLNPHVVAPAAKQLADSGLLEKVAEFKETVDLARRRMLTSVGLATTPSVLLVTAPEAPWMARVVRR